MSGQTRGLLIVVVVAGATTLFSRTAFAQIELSGNWNPLLSEDQQERVPGPAIGDYLGLPITDAARMKADAWDRRYRRCLNGSASRTRPPMDFAASACFTSGPTWTMRRNN